MDHDTNERWEVRGQPRENRDDGTDSSRGRTDYNHISRNPLRIDRNAHGASIQHPTHPGTNIQYIDFEKWADRGQYLEALIRKCVELIPAIMGEGARLNEGP